MNIIVIIDPGHGGIDPRTNQYVTPGKRSPVWKDGSQYFEGVGNRKIANIVAQSLKQKGVEFKFTVNPDDHRDVSLTERVKIANSIYKSKSSAILISIHSNAASTPTANGTEVWTWPGQTNSDKLADFYLKEQKSVFPLIKIREDRSDGDGDKETKFQILGVQCPAILIELLFHSNEQECKILMSDDGQKKLAQAIVNAIIKYKEWKQQ